MKAFIIKKEELQLADVPGPTLHDNEVMVKIKSWFVKIILSLISWSMRSKARKLDVDYSLLFMKANGEQLQQISKLIEQQAIMPVIDTVFPFEQTNNALKYVESGHAKRKVVVKMK